MEDLEVLPGMFHNLQYRVAPEIPFLEVQKEVEAEYKLLCTLKWNPMIFSYFHAFTFLPFFHFAFPTFSSLSL